MKPAQGLPTIRRTRRQRGQSAVEFALVVPFLVLVVFAGVDFSRAYLIHNAITNAVREGARYGAVHPTDPTTMRSRAKNEMSAATYTPQDSDIHISWIPPSPVPGGCPGGTVETETQATYQANPQCFSYVKVRIDSIYLPMTPLANQWMANGITLKAAVTMAIE
jgi:Flp pilus assembly protein TadG